MFERFTEEARQVVVVAQEEARLLRHDHVGTEHILLGLLRLGEGMAARALQRLGVTLARARRELERVVPVGDAAGPGAIPFTLAAKKVLEISLQEAMTLQDEYIGPEHILLGLARADEPAAAHVLAALEADADAIRDEVMRQVFSPGGSGRPARRIRVHGPRSPSGGSRFPATLIEDAGPVVETAATEIEEQLGRPPDAADLLLVLASIPGGLVAAVLARAGVERDSLERAVEEARQEDVTAGSLPLDVATEVERLRAEKEASIEAGKFEAAANLRDLERRILKEAEDRRFHTALTDLRARLGLERS